MVMTNPLVGKGWNFPPRTDGRGGIALAGDVPEIEQSIGVILGTGPGQRGVSLPLNLPLSDMLSCIARRTSRSSGERRIPMSWCNGQSSWAMQRWRSPIRTVSLVWCGHMSLPSPPG